jgi:small nuclear ribonucleoprotein (snRNP)-like protein
MNGDVVISEVDAHMYVVLNEAEEHVSYGELVGTREYINL